MWRQIGNFFLPSWPGNCLVSQYLTSLSLRLTTNEDGPEFWVNKGEKPNLLLCCCCKSLNRTQNISLKVRAGESELSEFSAHVWSFHLLTSLSQTPNGYLSDAVVGGVNVNPTLEWGGRMNKTADSSARRHLSSQLLMEFPLLLGGEQMVRSLCWGLEDAARLPRSSTCAATCVLLRGRHFPNWHGAALNIYCHVCIYDVYSELDFTLRRHLRAECVSVFCSGETRWTSAVCCDKATKTNLK